MAYTRGTFPYCCSQCSLPYGEPLLIHASTGDAPTVPGSFGSVSCGLTVPFLYAFMCTRFCLCPPRLESLFPLVLWKSYNQILRAFKVRLPGDSQVRKPDLVCQNFHNSRRTYWYYCSSVCGSPTSGYGMWFYCDCVPPAVASSLSLDVGFLFLVGSSVLLSMVVQ